MCGAEELRDEMSLKQVYLMNWSPRVCGNIQIFCHLIQVYSDLVKYLVII